MVAFFQQSVIEGGKLRFILPRQERAVVGVAVEAVS
jgi:hypothetical protein